MTDQLPPKVQDLVNKLENTNPYATVKAALKNADTWEISLRGTQIDFAIALYQPNSIVGLRVKRSGADVQAFLDVAVCR